MPFLCPAKTGTFLFLPWTVQHIVTVFNDKTQSNNSWNQAKIKEIRDETILQGGEVELYEKDIES